MGLVLKKKGHPATAITSSLEEGMGREGEKRGKRGNGRPRRRHSATYFIFCSEPRYLIMSFGPKYRGPQRGLRKVKRVVP